MDPIEALDVAKERIKKAIDSKKKSLNLSNLGLKKLPETIYELKNLRELFIYDNKIEGLSDKICDFSELSILHLSNNPLSTLPNCIGKLKKLTQLNCFDTYLDKLPEGIGLLNDLKILLLNGSKLSILPGSICSLKKLEEIDLSSTQLKELPDCFGELVNLQSLNLMKTKIEIIPENIVQLINLQTLNLSYTPLRELPDAIGQLYSLRTLNLNNTKLQTLPVSIGQMRSLEHLYLNDAFLKELPNSICQLPNLSELEMKNNKLVSIPSNIGNLNGLKNIELQGNQLTELPDSIGQLRNLSKLRLNDNNLKKLPKSIEKLTSLKILTLFNNDNLRIPTEILGSKERNVDPKKIIEYYIKTLTGERPLNEAKLILVGFGGVGKTSIVNRLLYNKFNEYEDKTRGIEITPWAINIENNWSVRLNVWDFGGQEIMHSTHQFFLTQRSLYLLVLNGRKGHEDSDAEYWLKLIESFGKDSPVIIVLNKFREHPFDVNRRGLMQKYQNVHEKFIETDCGDNPIGIEDLREEIKNTIKNLKHVRDPFPASWLSIKDYLATMKQNYISYAQYQEICGKNGENDSEAQDTLAFSLHSLGIILNFKDDKILRFTNVLNPHWVTNGIYEIINSTKIYNQKGVLNEYDIIDILDPKRYPENECKFLIRLMQKFELCFEFPDFEKKYLITELLDRQQPEEAEEFILENCLNFQYHYRVLPPGLLPRFIVRTHANHYNKLRWLTGVILKFGNNQALIKVDKEERRVHIAIKGPLSTRRELLAIIRADFKSINSFFASNPEEMVPIAEHPGEFISYQELEVRKDSNENKFTNVIGGKLVTLYTSSLLNGIELEDTGKRDFKEKNLFCSYSHKDRDLYGEFVPYLKLLEFKRVINFFADTQITAGWDWKQQIKDYLEQADIVLLFISANYFNSEYCIYEMNIALNRSEENKSRVIPVLLRDVNLKQTAIENLQFLPKDGEPMANKTKFRDTAWRNVSDGIEEAAKK